MPQSTTKRFQFYKPFKGRVRHFAAIKIHGDSGLAYAQHATIEGISFNLATQGLEPTTHDDKRFFRLSSRQHGVVRELTWSEVEKLLLALPHIGFRPRVVGAGDVRGAGFAIMDESGRFKSEDDRKGRGRAFDMIDYRLEYKQFDDQGKETSAQRRNRCQPGDIPAASSLLLVRARSVPTLGGPGPHIQSIGELEPSTLELPQEYRAESEGKEGTGLAGVLLGPQDFSAPQSGGNLLTAEEAGESE